MCSPRIIGIKLCSVGSDTSGQFIHTLSVFPNDKLSELRNKLMSEGISTILGGKKFAFLNPQGFKLASKTEHYSVYDIMNSDGSVHICVHDRPCLGIRIKCGDEVKIDGTVGDNLSDIKGFVYCDLSSTLDNLIKEISAQLPHLSESISKFEHIFLNQKGWPISRKQEESMTVVELCESSCITICLLQLPPGKEVSDRFVKKDKDVAEDSFIEDKYEEAYKKQPESYMSTMPMRDIGFCSPSTSSFAAQEDMGVVAAQEDMGDVAVQEDMGVVAAQEDMGEVAVQDDMVMIYPKE